jgi:hypothetical protein
VLVVGNQRAQIALLIVPHHGREPQEILNSIQPIINEINATSPTHSRLVSDLIQVLPSDAEIPKTQKGSIQRIVADDHFRVVIDDLYRLYEGGNANRLTLTSHAQGLEALRSIFGEIFPSALGQPEADLFSLGLDSLTATRIRNAINNQIQLPSPPASSVVYDHANLEDLSDYLWSASQSICIAPDENELAWELVREAKSALKPRRTGKEADLKTILLTGVTGGLGAHILASLQLRTDIKKVIVPIRATSASMAEQRLDQALTARHLPTTLNFEVLAIPESDLDDPNEHLSSVTHTIHAAWPVNFNYSLQSYRSHIRNTVRLLNYTSGPFVFISSISAYTNVEQVPELAASTPDHG